MVSAFLFAAMHQNIDQFFYAFAGGIVLGLLRVRTGSLFPSMIVHFFNNLLSVVLDYSEQHGGLSDGIYQAVYGGSNEYSALLIIASWGVALWAAVAVVRYLGQRANGYTSKKLLRNAEERLVVTSEPILVGIVALGFVTTLFTFVWGVMR
jgi:ABC-type Fe3+ transport system permease subunit